LAGLRYAEVRYGASCVVHVHVRQGNGVASRPRKPCASLFVLVASVCCVGVYTAGMQRHALTTARTAEPIYRVESSSGPHSCNPTSCASSRNTLRPFSPTGADVTPVAQSNATGNIIMPSNPGGWRARTDRLLLHHQLPNAGRRAPCSAILFHC
jgi:hypothetical protein